MKEVSGKAVLCYIDELLLDMEDSECSDNQYDEGYTDALEDLKDCIKEMMEGKK